MRLLLLVFLVALQPIALPAAVRLAVIGDYGVDDANERAVANLVISNFAPEFIVTVGDNNYLGPANIDRAVGKYYHAFIGNYSGTYGAGASSNRFFPALGNHDWDGTTGFSTHTAYFTLPGNERYYDFVRGPVHFLIVNSDTHEPDGATASSTQALWLSNRLRASVSPWKVVIAQDPPYSSTSPVSRMRWPFKEWGATMVISGHAHHYERIFVDGFPYIVNGAGGASLAAFGPVVPGSVVRYNAAHGAMLMLATETNLVCEFWSTAGGGTLIDRFTRPSNARMTVERQGGGLLLAWPTNATDGLVLESAETLMTPTWRPVSQTPTVTGSSRVLLIAPTNNQRFFRLNP